MRLLLLSNSTIPGLSYLEYAIPSIKSFFGSEVKNIAFVPFAGVTIGWDDYTAKVNEVLNPYGYFFHSVHKADNYESFLDKADAIAVGGGNTFKLVSEMHNRGLIDLIRKKVKNGMPFMGWSAGSNVACPSLRTTNDMPIVEPASFSTLNLVPFQINPHYLDKNPDGHGGETREDRINEFMELNRDIYIVGLREGTILHLENNDLKLLGDRNARIFHYGKEAYELSNKDDFNFLMA